MANSIKDAVSDWPKLVKVPKGTPTIDSIILDEFVDEQQAWLSWQRIGWHKWPIES